jgi:hypothetical protein
MVRPPLPFVLCVHMHSLRVHVCIYLCSIGTIRSGRFVPTFSRLNVLRLVAFIRAKKLTPLLSQYSQYYSHNAEMIVALKKLCGIADIELTVR